MQEQQLIMFIIKCIIDKYCKTKDGKVYVWLVDFQKAFYTVIHTGIKIKLLNRSWFKVLRNYQIHV